MLGDSDQESKSVVYVAVEVSYLDSQSEPADNHFVWAYHVRIVNSDKKTVQLLSRAWTITDAVGNGHCVIGDGVVGEQPILKPGMTFEYTSGTPLQAPSGIMSGRFKLIDEDGRLFNVMVPAFSLDSPHDAPSLH